MSDTKILETTPEWRNASVGKQLSQNYYKKLWLSFCQQSMCKELTANCVLGFKSNLQNKCCILKPRFVGLCIIMLRNSILSCYFNIKRGKEYFLWVKETTIWPVPLT